MATTKALLFSTALLLCLVIINLERADAKCDFQRSCTNIVIDDKGILTAGCPGGSGTGSTSLTLSQFIGNSDGNLVDGAGFTNSCQDISWYSPGDPLAAFYLKANCKDDGGQLELSSYDVSVHVYNSLGTLEWTQC